MNIIGFRAQGPSPIPLSHDSPDRYNKHPSISQFTANQSGPPASWSADIIPEQEPPTELRYIPSLHLPTFSPL